MKKMFIVAFIVAAAVGACGGKKKADSTTPPPDQGSATMEGSDTGSAAETPPAEGTEGAPEGGEATPTP